MKVNAVDDYNELASKDEAYRRRAHERLLRLEKAVFRTPPPTPVSKKLDPTWLLARLDRLEAAVKRQITTI